LKTSRFSSKTKPFSIEETREYTDFGRKPLFLHAPQGETQQKAYAET